MGPCFSCRKHKNTIIDNVADTINNVENTIEHAIENTVQNVEHTVQNVEHTVEYTFQDLRHSVQEVEHPVTSVEHVVFKKCADVIKVSLYITPVTCGSIALIKVILENISHHHAAVLFVTKNMFPTAFMGIGLGLMLTFKYFSRK